MLIQPAIPRFLLAVLQIDRICVARTAKKIKSALATMPRELGDLYGETVERIRRQPGEDGELGMRVLSWVTHTKRPLHVEELAHGLAVEYDDEEEAHCELDTDNLLSSRSLVDVCAGLVVIDPRSQIIRLVHYTAQEYFDTERLQLFENAEVDISNACLTYLSYDIANTNPSNETISDAIVSHPFLAYASIFWFLHVKEVSRNGRSGPVMQKSMKYVNDPVKIMFSAVVLRKLLLRPRTYARVFEDIHQKRRGDFIALEAASECGLVQLVKFLLDHSNASKSALAEFAVNYASAEGHTEVVALLIERGASVQSLTEDSSTALQKACKGGHFGVANILLQHGVNANTSDRWLWTPLHHAAHGGHSGLVALLLKNGANPNSQTPLGLTACHLAASRGDLETITLLLDAKYDLKLATRDKSTPLHKAAEERNLDVCRLLLQRGSDVQAKNGDGQTALDLIKDNTSPEVRGIFAPYIYAARGSERLPPLSKASFTQDPVVAAIDEAAAADRSRSEKMQEEDFSMKEKFSISRFLIQRKGRHRSRRRKCETGAENEGDTLSKNGLPQGQRWWREHDDHEDAVRERGLEQGRARAKDSSANIDRDDKACSSFFIPIRQTRTVDHLSSPVYSTADTDASELSLPLPGEVPTLRIIKSTPPETRSSSPIIKPKIASGEDPEVDR